MHSRKVSRDLVYVRSSDIKMFRYTKADILQQRKELGPYAYEDKMPKSLRKLLEEGPKTAVFNKIMPNGGLTRITHVENETKNLLPVLAQLCELDSSVEEAWLCHPLTDHIVKMPKEGSFCGYRNIQMLIRYIQQSKAEGCNAFGEATPGIFRLQDIIEEAWAKGINAEGKVETGGIRGTRKYIGTPEVRLLPYTRIVLVN